MGALEKLGWALDRALSVAAPRAALSRARARVQLDAARGYAAAQTTAHTGAWNPAQVDVNAILRADGPLLRARTRDLARNNPHISRACEALVDLVVGVGHDYQARVVGPGGELDEEANRRIEEYLARFAEQADFAGDLHLGELERVAKRGEVEAGEVLVVRRVVDDPARVCPLAYQLIEPERLAVWNTAPEAGNEVDRGVEFDPRTGRRVAYHIDRDGPSYAPRAPVRVPAPYVFHLFDRLRPGQLHGVTPFAAGVLMADALGDLMSSELQGSRMAAKWLAFVTSKDREAARRGNGGEMDAEGRLVEHFDSGMIQWLDQGEQVTLAQANRPGVTFDPFVSLLLESLAASAKLPVEMISGRYRGLNYTTIRGSRNDLAQALRPAHARHQRQLLTPLCREVIAAGVLTGRLELPGFWDDPRAYLAGEWIPPGMDPVDPLKEGRAAADQVRSNLDSEPAWIRRRGRDPEMVLRERAAYQKRARALGLVAAPVATGENTAPSQLTRKDADEEPAPEGEE